MLAPDRCAWRHVLEQLIVAGVKDPELVPLGPWPSGIDNMSKEDGIAVNELGIPTAVRAAVNIDWSREGRPQRRAGRTQRAAGTRMHSLWHGGELPFALCVDGDALLALHTDHSLVALRAGLVQREMSYAAVSDRVYFANGTDCGRVLIDGTVEPWALDGPPAQPTLVATLTGGLAAGRYQVAVTWRAMTGEESGTLGAALVNVADGGGIALTSIPQPTDPAIALVRVYMSGADGDALYWVRDLPVGMTATTLGTHQRGKPLDTQFLEPMPAGRIVRAMHGRLYVARGKLLMRSASLRYGYWRQATDYVRFASNIELVEPVGDGESAGLFVAAGKRTYWVSVAGTEYRQRIASMYGAVPGTAIRIPGNVVGFDSPDPVAYWLGANGVACIGLPGGAIAPIKANQVVAPAAAGGATLMREEGGLRQLITALQGARPQRLAVGDRVSARVYRHDE